MTNGCKTTWNFFGSGHGKGLHDGDGDVIKRFTGKEQLDANGAKLQNAKEVVQFLHEHLPKRLETSYSSARRPLRKVFWLVKEEKVPKNSLTFSCDSIKSTMKLHSILATNKNNLTTLMVKDLPYFYTFYFDGKWVDCQNLQWIGHWVPKILQLVDTRLVRNAMYDGWDGKWDYGVDGNALTTTLEIGDNFVMND
jgi:hypothetical protein